MNAGSLESVFSSVGAVYETVNGCRRPVRFNDPFEEAAAVRQGLGVSDWSHRAVVDITGADRKSYLHRQVTNDIEGLADGTGTYACHLTGKGKLVGDMIAMIETDRVVLETEPSAVTSLVEGLSKFAILDDCDFAIRPPGHAVLVSGPSAPSALTATLGGDGWDELAPYHHRTVALPDGDLSVAAIPMSGEADLVLRGDEVVVARIAAELLARDGAVPFGSRALDTLRVEAGIPLFGYDLDQETIPPEAGLDHAISYTKGCYVGQEVIARLKTYGNPTWNMIGLAMDEVVVVGATVRTQDGAEAGRVTSAVTSPAVGRSIALARIRRHYAETEETFVVDAETPVPADATPLPFVDVAFGPPGD